jgi:septal ring-binding cell division protein DamX
MFFPERLMTGDTKTSGTRRKTAAETKTVAKKAPTKTVAPAKKKVAATPSKAAAKTAKPAATTSKSPTARKAKTAVGPIAAETRLHYIQVAAYYIAERNGFRDDPATTWLAAEQEIDNLLMTGKLPS